MAFAIGYEYDTNTVMCYVRYFARFVRHFGFPI